MKTAIVHVCRGSSVVGVGFLVAPTVVCTCAHVVNQSLGRCDSSSEKPSSEIELEFAFVSRRRITAKVVRWLPVEAEGPVEDLALLELTDPAPSDVTPLPLLRRSAEEHERFRTYGPVGKIGRWISGATVDTVPNGWLQIECEGEECFQKGFSGSPLWSESLRAVLGAVIAVDPAHSKRTAFAVPSDRIGRLSIASDLIDPAVSPPRLHILGRVRILLRRTAIAHAVLALLFAAFPALLLARASRVVDAAAIPAIYVGAIGCLVAAGVFLFAIPEVPPRQRARVVFGTVLVVLSLTAFSARALVTALDWPRREEKGNAGESPNRATEAAKPVRAIPLESAAGLAASASAARAIPKEDPDFPRAYEIVPVAPRAPEWSSPAASSPFPKGATAEAREHWANVSSVIAWGDLAPAPVPIPENEIVRLHPASGPAGMGSATVEYEIERATPARLETSFYVSTQMMPGVYAFEATLAVPRGRGNWILELSSSSPVAAFVDEVPIPTVSPAASKKQVGVAPGRHRLSLKTRVTQETAYLSRMAMVRLALWPDMLRDVAGELGVQIEAMPPRIAEDRGAGACLSLERSGRRLEIENSCQGTIVCENKGKWSGADRVEGVVMRSGARIPIVNDTAETVGSALNALLILEHGTLTCSELLDTENACVRSGDHRGTALRLPGAPV